MAENQETQEKIAHYVHQGNVDADGMTLEVVPAEQIDTFPWERMPGEPHMWYQRFFLYFAKLKGHRRNILTAYRLYVDAETENDGASTMTVNPNWRGYAKKWDWVIRAEAYDEYLRLQDQERWEARQQALREREWATSNQLLDVADEVLDRLTTPVDEALNSVSGRVLPKPAVKAADVANFAKTGSDLARRATESTGDVTEHRVKVEIEEVRRKRWEVNLPQLAQVIENPDQDEAVLGEFIEDGALEPPVRNDSDEEE